MNAGGILRRVAILSFALLAAACGEDGGAPSSGGGGGEKDGAALERLTFRHLGAPGTVDLLDLADDLGYVAPVKLEYVGISLGGPQGIQTLLSGDTDISSSSFNSAIINVVASGAPMTAVIASYGYDTEDDSQNAEGGFFVLKDSDIHGPRDLIGKKIAVNALGAQAEVILSEYMRRGGLSKAEIKQVELIVVPPVSMERVLLASQVDVTSLTWPRNAGMRKLFSTIDLYQHFTAGSYVMSNRYLKENPNTSRHVITAMARAIEWARITPREEVKARMRQIIAKRGRNESNEFIDHFTGFGIASTGGVLKDEDYQIWLDWLIADGQIKPGAVDLKNVYTNAFNAYAK
jgi:ABC-type nitrate/sulfonate/bicarbonate transport system substrate-binding protein